MCDDDEIKMNLAYWLVQIRMFTF